MRRPVPLPASEEEPDDPGSRPAEPVRFTLRRAPAAREEHGLVPEPERDVAGVADSEGETSPIAGGQDGHGDPEKPGERDEGRDQGEDPATWSSSRVWRAARARRKALRAEIRRFTQRSRRRRMAWWSALGAVVVLVLGSVIAAYSPVFAVQRIVVAGATTLDPVTVEQALSDQLGSPLALVDAAAVKSALTEFPMIETYALEARPPHELVVRIVERTPIGVISSDAGFTLVDAAGVALSTTPQRPEGQPLLDIAGDGRSRAFRSAGLVVRSLPADLRALVTDVSATTGDDVTLRTADGMTIVWGSEEDSVRKARVLTSLMAAAPDARTFDVSSPHAAVVG